MAIVISGVNNNDKITASDGTIDLLSGVNYTGIITAPAFTTPGDITAASINVGNNIQLGNAGVTTATTFVGNLTGNVNATSNLLLQIGGSEKFRVASSGQLGIGGANYGTSGQVLTSGGSGSAATWSTVSGTTINNNANNRVITGSATANTLEGEANLIFDASGSLLIANTTGSRTNLSNNADDIVIGNTSTTNETGISMFSTSTSGIRFNDASGTDAAIEYSHSARELRFNSAGANRLQFGVNASNSPVFSLGTGHYSGDSNNHNQGDRASVKVGAYLHLESALGAGHNSRAGLGYNCYFSSLENFNCGTKSPSGGDNRPAAYGMAYGNHYFYSDASSTAHSAQASITMTKNMVIHRQGYVTKSNNPSFHVGSPNVSGNGGGEVWYGQSAIFSNVGSHYNNSNGRFTAPVAGQYFFFHWGMSNSSNQTCDVYSRKNGSRDQIGTSYNHPSGGQHDQFGCSYVRTLAAGDYVDVYTSTGNVYASSDGRHGGWGGWLIG